MTVINVYNSMLAEKKVKPNFALALEKFKPEFKTNLGLTLTGVCSEFSPTPMPVYNLTSVLSILSFTSTVIPSPKSNISPDQFSNFTGTMFVSSTPTLKFTSGAFVSAALYVSSTPLSNFSTSFFSPTQKISSASALRVNFTSQTLTAFNLTTTAIFSSTPNITSTSDVSNTSSPFVSPTPKISSTSNPVPSSTPSQTATSILSSLLSLFLSPVPEPSPTPPASSNSAPFVLNPIQHVLKVRVRQPLFYQIPVDTFYDVQDGDTRRLTLSLLTLNNVEPSPGYWIQLTAKQEIVVFPTFADFGHSAFRLIATDSQGAVARTTVEVDVIMPISSSTNLISQSFNVDFYAVHADTQMKLELFRGVTTFTNVDPSVMQVDWISPGSLVLTWFMTNITQREHCLTVLNVYNSMLAEKEVKPNFALALNKFKPEIKANLGLTLTGVCSEFSPTPTSFPKTAPFVVNPIQRITARVLQPLFYQIPHDTFYDDQDGNTRNLTLTLRILDNVEPTPDFWAQLTAKQDIVIFPALADIGLTSFFLIARDSQGAVARTTFEVFVLPAINLSSTNLISQSFNVDFNDVNADVQRILRLLRGVTTFTNIDPSVMQVESIAAGSLILSWFMTNITKREHCQTLFNVYRSMLTETEVQPNFARELDEFKPEFKASLGLTLKGVCNGSIVDVATTDGPSEEVVRDAVSPKQSPVNYVVPAVVAVVLLLVGFTVFILYRRRRREHLDIESLPERRKYLDGQTVVSDKKAVKNEFDRKPAQIFEKSVLSPPPIGFDVSGARKRVNSGEEDGSEISTRSDDETARWSSSPHRQPPPPPVIGSSGRETSLEANRHVAAYQQPPSFSLSFDSEG